jgi:hypothetical protein
MLSRRANAIDVAKLEQELTSTGIVGWIHGSVPDKGLFVFTYRNPEDFFDYIELSLVATDSNIQAQLTALKRHDKIRVKGHFLDNPSPQKHVAVSSIEMVKKYEAGYTAEAYSYDAKPPAELLKGHEALFLVHAIGGDGHILVAEYKDVVVPVFVTDTAATRGLSRNDIVRIHYKVMERPGSPAHLVLDPRAKKPVEMVEAIGDYNGKPASREGALVMFPKSPEIIFNVFAVLDETKAGLPRQFTIVNFEQPEVFKQMREKLQAAWDKYPGAYTNGRNKLINTKLRVRVSGTYNQVSANQANPQILVGTADDVQIIE